ncbi:MAG TPA: hypothetical protein VG753_02420 [Candidatus Paceibacterota bacterium]|nr:hypothetical protein [Candidatus Paceibacterota bacterium]
MTFWAYIGAFIAMPFLALSALFGGGTHMVIPSWPAATSTQPVATSSSLSSGTSSSTPSTHPIPTPTDHAITLYSVSKTSGIHVGDTITITGFGFTDRNTILLNGMAAARNVPITSSVAVACTTDPSCRPGIHQMISFTVPSSIGPDCKAGEMCPMYLTLLLNGTYNLTVENENGVSNAVKIEIIGAADIR